MPVPEQMTWVPGRKRWTRMHRGKRFWVSCKALGCPPTKEASVQAANAWWTAKQAELDAAVRPQRQPLPMEDIAAAWLGNHETILDMEKNLAEMIAGGASPAQDEEEEAAFPKEGLLTRGVTAYITALVQAAVLRLVSDGKLPEHVAAQLPPARLNQLQDAAKAIRGDVATSSDKSVKVQADKWTAGLEIQAAAGQITPARVNNIRMCLTHFTGWFGESADVTSIDASKLTGFYQHCLQQVASRREDKKAGWSVPFAKETFSIAKAFIRWLIEQGTITPPTNIAAKFKFGSAAKKVPTWSVEEVRHVIGEAPGKLKLALLLMANCGMTQIDVSDLLDSEVDWKARRIIRKRSKTRDNENAPEVNYKLWPLTWQLLKKYRSGKDTVLLTESGLPYVRSEMVKGHLKKADGFTSCYKHLQRRLKFHKSMKLLRKTGASMLESHEVYGRYASYFLGHAPRSMGDKHYVKPSQELFDAAVLWLGQQFGFVESLKK